MAGDVGRAFVQVFADLSKFTPGLRRDLKKALDESLKDADFQELGKKAEAAGENAAEEVGKGIDKKAPERLKKSGREAGNSFRQGLMTAFSVMATALMPTLIGLGVELVAALAPAAAALGATLPVAIFTAVSALAVLKMATNGVGAALKDAFDPARAQQFNAEMKKLSPAARDFVHQVQAVHPLMHQLQQDVQETFFTQLRGALVQLVRNLFPALRVGLHNIARDLGQMGKALATTLGSRREDIASIFLAAHNVLQRFVPLVGQLAGAFISLGAVAGPLVDQLTAGFASLVTRFTTFIEQAANSGALADFFTSALGILKQVGGLLGNVWGLVQDILSALQASGGQALGLLGGIVGLLAQFFATPTGKQTLASLFNLLNAALRAVFAILGPLLPPLGKLVTFLADDLARGLVAITPGLEAVSKFLAENPKLIYAAITAWGLYRAAVYAAAVAQGILDAAMAANPIGLIVLGFIIWVAQMAATIFFAVKIFMHFKGQIWDGLVAIGRFFRDIWGDIEQIVLGVVHWFESLPSRIWAALQALPGLLWKVMNDALHLAGEAIGVGIGLIIGIFLKTPGWIWGALKDLGHLLASLFSDAWHFVWNVITTDWAFLVSFFSSLPGRIWGALKALPGVLRDAFHTAWEWVKRTVSDGADAVVAFVKALPGRLRGFFGNVGHDIIGGLKSGINAVIDGINSGINKAAGFLHISLPNIPRLASGGLVNQPTLAVVGEAGPEAVIPMSNPAAARRVAGQTGLLTMLGSQAMQGAQATIVHVYLGTREIMDILDTRVERALDDQALALAHGTR